MIQWIFFWFFTFGRSCGWKCDCSSILSPVCNPRIPQTRGRERWCQWWWGSGWCRPLWSSSRSEWRYHSKLSGSIPSWCTYPQRYQSSWTWSRHRSCNILPQGGRRCRWFQWRCWWWRPPQRCPGSSQRSPSSLERGRSGLRSGGWAATCDSLRPALLSAGGQEVVGDDDYIVGRGGRGGGRPLDAGDQDPGLLDQGSQQGNLKKINIFK